MTPSEMNELNFLAFRYVTNELTEGERFSFETRLAEDLVACEAVAAAVELTQALALNCGELEAGIAEETRAVTLASDGHESDGHELERPTGPRSGWLRPAAWMSMGAAACLVAVLISQAMKSPQNDPLIVNESPSITRQRQAEARAEKLALVWSQMRHVEAAEDLSEDEDDHDDAAEDAIAEDHLSATEPAKIVANEVTSPKTNRTPSWISAAVSGLAKASPSAPHADDDVEEL